MVETDLVHRSNNHAFTTAKMYLDEISLMCEMYLELTGEYEFIPDNFNGTLLNAISALSRIAHTQDVIFNRDIFQGLRSKIYEWYSLTLDSNDEFTDNFMEGIYLTLSAITMQYMAHSSPFVKQSLTTEKWYKDDIVNRFCKIDRFKGYKLVKSEFKIYGGSIDILACDNSTGRDVLMELKLSGKSGHKQLYQYGFHFNNPILINISEKIPVTRFEGIEYLTFSELS